MLKAADNKQLSPVGWDPHSDTLWREALHLATKPWKCGHAHITERPQLALEMCDSLNRTVLKSPFVPICQSEGGAERVAPKGRRGEGAAFTWGKRLGLKQQLTPPADSGMLIADVLLHSLGWQAGPHDRFISHYFRCCYLLRNNNPPFLSPSLTYLISTFH